MPDSAPPGDRLSLRVKDFCVDVSGSTVGLSNLSMHGCTFRVAKCSGSCAIADLNITYPSYHREIHLRDPKPFADGPPPNVTLLHANDSTVDRVSIRSHSLAVPLPPSTSKSTFSLPPPLSIALSHSPPHIPDRRPCLYQVTLPCSPGASLNRECTFTLSPPFSPSHSPLPPPRTVDRSGPPLQSRCLPQPQMSFLHLSSSVSISLALLLILPTVDRSGLTPLQSRFLPQPQTYSSLLPLSHPPPPSLSLIYRLSHTHTHTLSLTRTHFLPRAPSLCLLTHTPCISSPNPHNAANRYSNSAGIKVVGNNNRLSELLVLDTDWLATLDYPPIEFGFGLAIEANNLSNSTLGMLVLLPSLPLQ